MAVDEKRHWADILDAVAQRPLAFMGLYTLVLTAALPIILLSTQLTPNQDFGVVIGYAVLIVLGLTIVVAMTIWYPSNLRDLTRAAERVESIRQFIESQALEDFVLDIVNRRLEQNMHAAPTSKESQK